MLLILTGKDDVTADLVVNELALLKADFVRFNTETFPAAASVTVEYLNEALSCRLLTSSRDVALDHIETVWFRKPQPPTISDRVQNEQARDFARQESDACISGLYRLLDSAFWVSRPDSIRRANDKLLQLAVAQKLGFRIPRTIVTNNPQHAETFCRSISGQTVIKPLKSGHIEYPDGRVELIYTSLVTPDDVAHVEKVAYAPCLFQEYVPKQYEVRVTAIGRRLFPVGLDSQKTETSRHDWRRANSEGLSYFQVNLPPTVAKKCLEMMEYYDLQFSAFDFIVTPENEYVFLENNPNGQWAWLDLELHNGMIRCMAEFLTRGHHEVRRLS